MSDSPIATTSTSSGGGDKDKEIAQLQAKLAAANEQLHQKDEQLHQKDEQLHQKDQKIATETARADQEKARADQADVVGVFMAERSLANQWEKTVCQLRVGDRSVNSKSDRSIDSKSDTSDRAGEAPAPKTPQKSANSAPKSSRKLFDTPPPARPVGSPDTPIAPSSQATVTNWLSRFECDEQTKEAFQAGANVVNALPKPSHAELRGVQPMFSGLMFTALGAMNSEHVLYAGSVTADGWSAFAELQEKLTAAVKAGTIASNMQHFGRRTDTTVFAPVGRHGTQLNLKPKPNQPKSSPDSPTRVERLFVERNTVFTAEGKDALRSIESGQVVLHGTVATAFDESSQDVGFAMPLHMEYGEVTRTFALYSRDGVMFGHAQLAVGADGVLTFERDLTPIVAYNANEFAQTFAKFWTMSLTLLEETAKRDMLNGLPKPWVQSLPETDRSVDVPGRGVPSEQWQFVRVLGGKAGSDVARVFEIAQKDQRAYAKVGTTPIKKRLNTEAEFMQKLDSISATSSTTSSTTSSASESPWRRHFPRLLAQYESPAGCVLIAQPVGETLRDYAHVLRSDEERALLANKLWVDGSLALSGLHDKEYCLADVDPTNIIVTEQNHEIVIVFIDLESMVQVNDSTTRSPERQATKGVAARANRKLRDFQALVLNCLIVLRQFEYQPRAAENTRQTALRLFCEDYNDLEALKEQGGNRFAVIK